MNPHILRMLEGSFSIDVALMKDFEEKLHMKCTMQKESLEIEEYKKP